MGWLDLVSARPALEVAEVLGLEVHGSAFGPCPACSAERRGKGGRRPPCGVKDRESPGWACHACGASGDSLDLVARVKLGGRPATGDRGGYADLRAECAALGLCPPQDAPGRPRTPPGHGQPPYPHGEARPAAGPRPARAPDAGGLPPPPPAEVEDLWDACRRVDALDPGDDVGAWLDGRGFDRAAVAALDLARCLPPGGDCPSWAGTCGEDWRPWKPWSAGRWRLLLPLHLPGDGAEALVSCWARWAAPGNPPKLKELVPKGCARVGLLADSRARALLAGKVPEDLEGVLLAEGGTDWLHAALAVATGDAPRLAVLGGVEGSWGQLPEALAALPRDVPVYAAQDPDKPGDRYAEACRLALAPRPVFRVKLRRNPDGTKAEDLDGTKAEDLDDRLTAEPRALRDGEDGSWGLLHMAREDGPMEDPTATTPPGEDLERAETKEERDAREAQEAAAERLRDLDAGRVGAFLDDALARMKARAEGSEKPIPLPWPSVAAELGGGLWPGMYVLVGNTGSGKSQWALQAALHAAREDIPVLYIGLELGRLDLVARLVGLISGRKWSRLYLGSDPGELAEVEARHGEALAELRRLPFHLEMAPPHGWDYRRLDGAAWAMRERYPEAVPGKRPFLVVLDFLQLVASPPTAREDQRERIGKAAYAGRAVARDYGAAVVLVSSTAREHYGTLAGEDPPKKKGSKPPPPLGKGNAGRLVGLGKESGEVEYAGDGALVLAAEPWPDGRPPADGMHVWLAVAKVRAKPEGASGWVPLRFDGGRFREPTPAEVAADFATRTAAPALRGGGAKGPAPRGAPLGPPSAKV